MPKRKPRKSPTRKPTRRSRRLPEKPSALILAALEDLVAVERSNRFTVNMSQWVAPPEEPDPSESCEDPVCTVCRPEELCEVCFAGSVMVMRLGADPTQKWVPGDFPKPVKQKLLALDDFREGNVAEALKHMGYETDLIIDQIVVDRYEDDPTEFKRDMRKLAANLKRMGC